MHQQGPGHLADPQPQRRQYPLAVPPGGELVLPEPRTHPVPEPPRIAAVVAPGRQPRAQLVIIGQHGPVPQPLGDLPRYVDDERLLAPAGHPVHPPCAVKPVPDAGRAEPRAHVQRGDDVPGLVPRRPHRRRPGGRVTRRGAEVVPLPDPDFVHDRLVVVAREPGQVGAHRGQDPGGRGCHRGDSTQNSVPSGSASTVQETGPWPTSDSLSVSGRPVNPRPPSPPPRPRRKHRAARCPPR
jgi:hypothetical protein